MGKQWKWYVMYFFPSVVQAEDEGGHDVFGGKKKNCRPVRKLLQSSCLSPADTAEKGRNRQSWKMAETEAIQSQFISPQGKKM